MKYLLILIVLLPAISFSQKIGDGFMNIYQSVGMVSYLPNSTTRNYGTGTIIHRIYGKNRDSISFYLVTCKHVLPQFRESKSIYFDIANPLSPSKFSTMLLWVYDSTGKYDFRVRVDPDSNDVAVINITELIALPQYKFIMGMAIPYEMLMSQDSIKTNGINIGDEVFFIGYPKGWYDKRNISPIVRKGIISSKPEEDFYISDLVRASHFEKYREWLPVKLHGFLIDGNAVGGSSGSLVFLKPQLVRFNDGHLEFNKGGGEPFILGLLSQSFIDPNAFFENIKLNIGGVISAGAIQKTIKLFGN